MHRKPSATLCFCLKAHNHLAELPSAIGNSQPIFFGQFQRFRILDMLNDMNSRPTITESVVELTDSVVELIDCLTKSTAKPVKISLWLLALAMCERYIYISPSKLP